MCCFIATPNTFYYSLLTYTLDLVVVVVIAVYSDIHTPCTRGARLAFVVSNGGTLKNKRAEIMSADKNIYRYSKREKVILCFKDMTGKRILKDVYTNFNHI